jgi:hypothetical protein
MDTTEPNNVRRIYDGVETKTIFAKLMIDVASAVNAIIGELYLIILNLGAMWRSIRRRKPQLRHLRYASAQNEERLPQKQAG